MSSYQDNQSNMKTHGGVPVIDISTGAENVSEQLVEAIRSVGFVYLTNHGVPPLWVNTVYQQSDVFFNQPSNVKAKYTRTYVADRENRRKLSRVDSGYTPLTVENLQLRDSVQNRTEMRESYDVVFQEGLSMKFPDDIVPELRPAALRLLKSLSSLGIQILRAIGKGLQLKDYEHFAKQHSLLGKKGNLSALRILHYPPLPKHCTEKDTIRCGDHADFGSITLLFQDDIGGLEVLNHNNQWVSIKPLKDAILLNMGEILQLWTNGSIKAPRHRVRVTKDKNIRTSPRRSVVFFLIPDNHVEVTTLHGKKFSLDNEHLLTVGEFMALKLSEVYDPSRKPGHKIET